MIFKMSRFLSTSIILAAFFVVCVYSNHNCTYPCGANERCNACGNLCETKCSNLDSTGKDMGACPYICNPPACECEAEYARDERTEKCVPKQSCPRQ
ncbi:chymotrypsin/elastase isoinhibitors 2 to 5 [Microplitis demolitor]|uniref:chymotrypsin/elastase isoinhibitors 2 to 5 n=1 Tax=Microplitis demolitor TaxID=69319 RepID=UPI0004CC948F|nr:chymotrypsin/elastase isoinhibitors 2 to 5 [Microplitis demolitor]